MEEVLNCKGTCFVFTERLAITIDTHQWVEEYTSSRKPHCYVTFNF